MMDTLYETAKKRAPEEMCGIITNDNEFIEFENIAENKKSHFKMDAITFGMYQLKSNIKYVVHSHYDSKCNPSEDDINNCNSVGIPYLIVSYPEKDYCIVEPK
ncbi:Mov34/MPN/PAD-1 family protein [Gammaproteobacteria bacterium]|jgi:proteasome lid subunit RPN8/RPN11|nr:Mov34/MPN/PAD-1 family protein [Gammaproteobacteria bacterium]